MFRDLLRRLGLTAPPDRSVSRIKRLRLESLESRDVPATIFAIGEGNNLLRFDSESPNAVNQKAITGLGTNQTVRGIDFRPSNGKLVITAVTTGSTANSQLFTYDLNPLTATATLIGASVAVPKAGDFAGGFDFNPAVDRIRYVNFPGENARINPTDGSLAGDDTDLTAGSVLLGVAYDRNDKDPTTPTTLFGIEGAGGNLVRIGGVDGNPSPNDGAVTTVGSLGTQPSFLEDGGFDISDTGAAFAAFTNDLMNRTELYSINLTTGAATFVSIIGDGNTEIYGIAIAPRNPPVLIVGSGLGADADVRALDPTTGAILKTFVGAEPGSLGPFVGFKGGVRVAAGDVNGDGVTDAIVAAIAPQGHIKVFDGETGVQITDNAIGSFFAYPNFMGTVKVAAGDVNGDGFADVVVVAGGNPGTNGHVKAFSGKDGSELASFFAYSNYDGEVSIAATDLDNDGNAEIITVAAAGGDIRLFKADGTKFTSTRIQQGPINSTPDNDVSVAAGDVTGDGLADVVVYFDGSARVFGSPDGQPISFSPLNTFLQNRSAPGRILGSTDDNGANLALTDTNGDGLLDIVATPNGPAAVLSASGPFTVSTLAKVVRFASPGFAELSSFDAFANFLGGASVAGT